MKQENVIKGNFYKKLHEQGQRITSQKQIVLELLLNNTDYMLSAAQLFERLGPKSMDAATVYRILQAFHDAGIIESHLDPQGVAKYKICDSTPHHHMICNYCGRIINFPCEEVFWEKYLHEYKFSEESHQMEIYGKCEECSNKND